MEQIQQIDATEVEQGQATSPDVSVEAQSVEGAAGLHAELDGHADDADISGFKCTDCGLAHMHGTNKHRASDSFDVSDDEAATMEYNPNCHCGVQELGRHGADLGVDEGDAARIASGAPIPDAASREMNAQFGSL